MVLLYHILRLLVKRCKGLEIFVKDVSVIIGVEDRGGDADTVFSCFTLVHRKSLTYRLAVSKSRGGNLQFQ